MMLAPNFAVQRTGAAGQALGAPLSPFGSFLAH